MDIWYMYMPVSGVDILWPGLLLIGFSVGVIGGFFGMGGAWMVTPGLNILGFPMAFAIGTDIAHVAGKSIISTFRHSKFGNVDYKLGLIMIAGTFAGIEVGAQLIMKLERMGVVEPVVRWIYVGFLALISLLVFYDYFKATSGRKKRAASEDPTHMGAGGINWAPTLHKIRIPPMVHFHTAGIYCSAWLPIFVSFLTGVLAGFLGIGGGLLRMPALVYLIGAPTHVAVGTDLFEVMISGLYGAFTYSVKGRIELVAVFVMLCGAAIGAQIGTVATKYARGYGIRLLFGLAVVACLISIILKQFQFNIAATVLILGTISALCIQIMVILFAGAAAELREKRKMLGQIAAGADGSAALRRDAPPARATHRRNRERNIIFILVGAVATLIAVYVAIASKPVDVAQGQCLSFDQANRTLVVRNELDQSEIAFDLAEIQVGIIPQPGDIVRVAYHPAGQKNMARRVMNVTRLDIRK